MRTDEASMGEAENRRQPAADLNVLYLDTNILTASNWPNPSVALANLFSMALWLKVAVFIPESVDHEAEEHWLRGVTRKSGAA